MRWSNMGLLASGALAVLLTLFGSPHSAAQSTYPNKPVRIVVPTAAGGATDLTARNVAEFLAKALKEPFVVENRPGAQGRVAATYFLQQPSDGYTLFMMASSQSVLPTLYKLSYDTLRDFTPIALLSTAPVMLLVNKDLPVSNVSELVAYAKKNPDKITFGYQGAPPQLAGLTFGKMVGIKAIAVPFNSSAQALMELVGGRLTYLMTTADVAKAQAEGGTIRVLAAAGDKRAAVFPEIPTLLELGYNIDGGGWFGLVGPRDLPRPIVDRIYAALRDGYFGKEPQRQMERAGLEPADEGPAQFGKRLATAIARWQQVGRDLGIEQQ